MTNWADDAAHAGPSGQPGTAGVLPALVRMSTQPRRGLVRMASVATLVFLVISFVAGQITGLAITWIMFALSVALTALVSLFEWRMRRFTKRADAAEQISYVTNSTVSVPLAEQSGAPYVYDLRGDETGPQVRYLPRVAAMQRAMIEAEGGTVNAPYLRDDLRITLVSFIGTLLALPLSLSGTFFALFILLIA